MLEVLFRCTLRLELCAGDVGVDASGEKAYTRSQAPDRTVEIAGQRPGNRISSWLRAEVVGTARVLPEAHWGRTQIGARLHKRVLVRRPRRKPLPHFSLRLFELDPLSASSVLPRCAVGAGDAAAVNPRRACLVFGQLIAPLDPSPCSDARELRIPRSVRRPPFHGRRSRVVRLRTCSSKKWVVPALNLLRGATRNDPRL